MFDDGLIKPNGQGGYQTVVDPNEQEQIRKSVSLSKRKQTMTPAEAERMQQQLPDNSENAEDYELE